MSYAITERPIPAVALPAIVKVDGVGVVHIHYDAILHDGRKIPFQEHVGNPDDQLVPVYYPRAWAWYQCIRAYHELQAMVNQIAKERDDAIAAAAAAEGKAAEVEKALVSERARTAELQRRKGKGE